jgi:hypothetical protein
MNRSYIDKLINKNRIGILIKLIKVNAHKWSINNFQYIFEQCIEHKLYDIFHFMMDYFIRSNCISFYDNRKYVYYVNIFVWICKNGHIDMVKYLLSNKVTKKYPYIDLCADDNRGLRSACWNENVNMVKYLLSEEVTIKYPNIDPCAQNNSGLLFACTYGRVNMVKYLLLDEVTEKYPKLQPKNLDKQLKIDIEKLLDYRI